MKECYAILLSDKLSFHPGDEGGALPDDLEIHPINNLLWSNNGYRPQVSFQIAYTSCSIWLKYIVLENYTTPVYHQINDPVYKDSCVEFFIAFNQEPYYYNLEFNRLGIPLVGYGCGKHNRKKIDGVLIEGIKAHNMMEYPLRHHDMLVQWELTLNIPFNVFAFHAIGTLKDHVCKVNFYKCGDDLPQPHFLSWNNIDHPTPDFHLPEFFGSLHFI